MYVERTFQDFNTLFFYINEYLQGGVGDSKESDIVL